MQCICIRFEFEEKTTNLLFPTTKGSMNACIEFVGLGTSKKVKNHCPNRNVFSSNVNELEKLS